MLTLHSLLIGLWIALTAAICLSVLSFIMGQAKPQPKPLDRARAARGHAPDAGCLRHPHPNATLFEV
jgi:MFS superfamily sulfate permease-like transporter